MRSLFFSVLRFVLRSEASERLIEKLNSAVICSSNDGGRLDKWRRLWTVGACNGETEAMCVSIRRDVDVFNLKCWASSETLPSMEFPFRLSKKLPPHQRSSTKNRQTAIAAQTPPMKCVNTFYQWKFTFIFPSTIFLGHYAKRICKTETIPSYAIHIHVLHRLIGVGVANTRSRTMQQTV